MSGLLAVRPEVQQLVDLGPFPASSDADEHDLDRRGAILKSISPPLSREEGLALLACFGPDEAFGLAWTLLHLVETTPGGPPLLSKPGPSENEWIRRLWDRAHR